MMVLVRTIRPPCGVVRFLQRWRSSSLTADERAFGVLGPLAQFVGPKNRDQPALLPDVAPDTEAPSRCSRSIIIRAAQSANDGSISTRTMTAGPDGALTT